MKKNFLLLFFSISFGVFAQQTSVYSCQHMHQQGNNFQIPQNPSILASQQRSDTIDLLKITINLNITDLVTDTIRGNTKIHYAPKMNNISVLDLDLLHMTIDSVKENNILLSHTYTDTLLKITLASPHNTTDTNDIIIYYHGNPQMDPSGWGGFYFQSGYAYNLGVGFGSNPHCFGRAWFPCFDNFVERSTYEFNITTDSVNRAFCNGMLMLDSTYSGLRKRKWVLDKTIVSYLASVALATYAQVNWTFNSINGPIPIILTALPTDTTNMKNSFVHLLNALSIFENHYGPYMWPRVGYCLVPFNSGAMEHATNISYPRLAANGSLTYEASIMAHELSHHWHGDLATCHNQGQMWLNEGWATYSQYLFTENYYGYPAYISGIRSNHDDMVHYVHLREGGFLTEDSIPFAYTYGDHVYKKGADLAHTLRGYMGDSLFFEGLKHHFLVRQYVDVTSLDLRDDMIAAGGNAAQVTSYFNDWILHPGWPQFSIDSFKSVVNGSNYDVTVYMNQKLKGAPSFYNNVPLDLTFMNNAWTSQTKKIIASGQNSSATFTIPFSPDFVIVDLNDKISDAVTTDTKVVKTTGNQFSLFANGRMQLNVQAVVDSAYVHIDHNWVAPDPFKSWGNHYRLTDHYWTVTGIFPANFYTKATFTYDGRTSTSGGSGNMDNIILTATNLEDSLVLLYRKDASDDWHLYPHYTKNMNVMTDKYGTMQIDSLKPGEYTIARIDHTVGIEQRVSKISLLKVYPNPATEEINIELTNSSKEKIQSVKLFSIDGKLVLEKQLNSSESKCTLNVSHLSKGIYYVSANLGGIHTETTKVIIGK